MVSNFVTKFFIVISQRLNTVTMQLSNRGMGFSSVFFINKSRKIPLNEEQVGLCKYLGNLIKLHTRNISCLMLSF